VTNFHPSDNDLLEFSAGNLDWALSICVSAHLQFCPSCKNKVKKYNCIGGSLLSQSTGVEVSKATFSSLMNRIHQAKEESTDTSITSDGVGVKQEDSLTHPSNEELNVSSDSRALPDVVQKLIPKGQALKWSFVSPSLRAAQLTTGQNKYEVCFHKIKRGGKVAEHDHRGLEVTLVLKGSFSDADGNYMPGDFIVKEPGDVHRPIAAQDQDCLCLSVVAAPVKVKGAIGKIVNPFLSIDPR